MIVPFWGLLVFLFPLFLCLLPCRVALVIFFERSICLFFSSGLVGVSAPLSPRQIVVVVSFLPVFYIRLVQFWSNEAPCL